MHWIYFSPHFDDVVLSCGGLVWEQTRRGETAEIWTLCAGQPSSTSLTPFARELHTRWQTGADAVGQRAEEDHQAAARLGASIRHLSVPDCIYRYQPGPQPGQLVPVITGEADLQNPHLPLEEPLLADLVAEFHRSIPAKGAGTEETCLVSPLAVGSHLDHRLARAAVERYARESGLPIFYYADFPYVLKDPAALTAAQADQQLEPVPAEISTAGLAAWQDAVAAYTSQISTFWSGLEEMREVIRNYWADGGGMLWVHPE